MIFSIIGGDNRFVRLRELLRRDGHRVRCFALENASEDCCASPEAALEGAECIILPLPCVRDGCLCAPLSKTRHAPEDILRHAAPGTPVLAGKADGLSVLCRELSLPLKDYFAREDFSIKNAALTAEGALSLLLRDGERGLRGRRILVCGFGRIGKFLALKLKALDADVCVAARSAADLAWAECLGFETADLKRAPSLEGFSAVCNTIPATIFSGERLRAFAGAAVYELASPPYGFDLSHENAGELSLTLAPGLPGAYAPEGAAEVIRDTIYHILGGFF